MNTFLRIILLILGLGSLVFCFIAMRAGRTRKDEIMMMLKDKRNTEDSKEAEELRNMSDEDFEKMVNKCLLIIYIVSFLIGVGGIVGFILIK